MKDDVARLRREITETDDKVYRLKAELSRTEANCKHVWSTPISDDIYEKAYTIEGDAPGTMGVDWRGPVHVSAKTTKRWKRFCLECGKVQHTTNTNKQVTETARF